MSLPVVAEEALSEIGRGQDEKNLAVGESRSSDRGSTVVNTTADSVWTIVGCALANLSDGYQQNLASSTNVVMKHLLDSTVYTSIVQTRISNALLIGSIIGIIILGYTSDRWSRKGGMLFTSFLVVVGSLLCTLALQVQALGDSNMLWFLAIARGIAGVGVGGEYPASAAAALEGSNEHFDSQRGPIQVVISTLMATAGGPICTFVYLMALLGSNDNLKVAFHAMYSISIFLPIFVVLFRLKMRDALLFRKSNFKRRRIPWILLFRRYGFRLLGTCSAFFLYDFVNFPNSIMSSAIINSLVPTHSVRTVAIWQIILAIFPFPGVLLGAYLVNRIGRRYTGILGFAAWIVLGFFIGGFYTPLTTHTLPLFIVLYGFLQAFGHMGPGATIGLISAESYPTAVRGMGYGLSAGFGKAGAAIGTQAFTPIQEKAGNASTFFVAGGVGVLGCAVYWFLIEGKGIDLEREDREFEAYLKEMGVGEVE